MKKLPITYQTCCIALAVASAALPKPAEATTQDTQAWFTETLTAGLNSSTNLSVEGSERFRPAAGGGDIYLVRMGLDHALAKNLTAGGGVQYFASDRSDELRLYQQAEWSRHGLALRVRIEERFQPQADRVAWRWRQRVEWSHPLSHDGKWIGKLNSELFFQLNNSQPSDQTGLTVLRGQVSLQRQINKHWRIQAAYMYNQNIRQNAEDRASHTPWITLNYRL